MSAIRGFEHNDVPDYHVLRVTMFNMFKRDMKCVEDFSIDFPVIWRLC